MKKRRQHQGIGIYSYIILKSLLALGVILVMQLFFYLCNTPIFNVEGTEWWGIFTGNLVFGAATMVTFLAPWLLLMLLPFGFRWKRGYRIIAEIFYLLGVALIIIPRAANAAYYQFTYRLLSDEIFSYLGISGQMGSLAPLFAVDYWYAWVFPLVIFILFLLLNGRMHIAPARKNKGYQASSIAASLLGVTVAIILARGGIGKPLTPASAATYCQSKNTALVNNDGYNILRTLFIPELEETQFMSSDEAARLYHTLHSPNSTTLSLYHSTTPKNIVFIIVESLSQEYMGCYNTQPGADTRTPFLDSLAQHSTLYDGRANGKKSIEGITAINTSIPTLMYQPFTNSKYGEDDFIGLPTILKRHGYHTAFYHGTYNGVMDFDRLCAKIGFDEYLGKDEYEAEVGGRPEDYDGAWGILDEPFLQYTVRHISQTSTQPFFAEIFTVSSHHPYPMPEEYKERFVEGKHPILKCVEYTDNALRLFFEEARKQPWYENTVFIITADHSGQGLSPEYNDYDGWYRIPLIIFEPTTAIKQSGNQTINPRIVQQIDLYPSIVDQLGLQDTFVCFGTSILQKPKCGDYVYYGNGYHCLISNDTEEPIKHNITILHGKYTQGDSLQLQYLQALIQQYNDRIINNNLIVR